MLTCHAGLGAFTALPHLGWWLKIGDFSEIREEPRNHLAGKGFPPKAQGHVSQPVQLKSKAKYQTDGMESELYRLLCRRCRLWVLAVSKRYTRMGGGEADCLFRVDYA